MDGIEIVQDAVTGASEDGDFEEERVGKDRDPVMEEASLGPSEQDDIQRPDMDSVTISPLIAVSSHDTPTESNEGVGSPTGQALDSHQLDNVTWTSPGAIILDTGQTLLTPISSSTTSPAHAELQLQAHSLEKAGHKDNLRPQPRNNFLKLDSKCVLACAHILATLENYLLSDLKTLELVLRETHKATEDLKQLVSLQQESRCERCIILFTAILFQIVSLLEVGTAPQPDHEVGIGLPGSNFAGLQTDFIPALGFGTFSITDVEKSSWKSQMVLRECRHVGEVLSSVTGLAEMGIRGSYPELEMVKYPTHSLKALEERLNTLSARQ